MPEDIKPVGQLKPYQPTEDIKPVGKLKPLVEPVYKDTFTQVQEQKPLINKLADVKEELKASLDSGSKLAKTFSEPKSITQGQPTELKAAVTQGETTPTAGVPDHKGETFLPLDLYHSFLKGSAQLGASLAETPAFIYNAAAAVTNPIGEKLGLGKPAHIEPENVVSKYYKGQVELAQKEFEKKYDKSITEYFNNGEWDKGFGLLANSVAESAPTTIALAMGNAAGVGAVGSTLGGGAVFGAGKYSEVAKNSPELPESTKIAVSAANGLFEGIFEQIGITKLGSVTKDVLLKDGKEAAMQFAKDGFEKTYGKVVKQYVKTGAEESLGEAATQFAQNAVDKYSGYKPDLNLTDGVADAAIIGLGASVGATTLPTALEANKVSKGIADEKVAKIERDNERSQFAFDVVTKGDIAKTKENLADAVKHGHLSENDAAAARFRIDAYEQYHNDTKNLPNISDEQKRELFDKAYFKEDLELQVKGVNPEKLNAIELAKYEGLKKQAKHLQEDINKIILAAQIKEEVIAGDKAIEGQEQPPPLPKEEVEKPILSPELQAMADRYKPKPIEKKKAEERSYQEIPVAEFNHKDYNARFKHEALANELESIPNKQFEGKITERKYAEPSGKINSVYSVELPDGKKIGLASSMERKEGFRGHMRTEHLVGESQLEGFPVGVKLEYLPDGKRVIKVYNGKTGKFISWAKETNTGKKKDLSEKQVDQLEHLSTVDEKPLLPPTESVTNTPVTPKTPIVTKSQPLEKTNVQADYGNEKNTTSGKESSKGDNLKNLSKATKEIRTGKEKAKKIRHPEKKAALNEEAYTPHDLAMQYFIGNGKVSSESIYQLYGDKTESTMRAERRKDKTAHKGVKFKGSSEVKARLSYVKKNAPSIENIAEKIVAENEELNLDYNDVRNAVEEVVSAHNNPTTMARDFNKSRVTKEFNTAEQELNQGAELADEANLTSQIDLALDLLEGLSDEQLIEIANEQDKFNNWYEENADKIAEASPIITNDDMEDQFQKSTKTKGNIYVEHHKSVQEVVEHIQKSLPKVKVVYNKKLVDKEGKPAAGVLTKKGEIQINPYYADIDTPIHEAGHVLIDAIGYDNKVIQSAIKQLKTTDLWEETEGRYPELNEEMLAKEVLAEAIGREGKGIFDTEVAKNKFMQYLDYIFTRLKQILGIDRNVAKSLAKQIIGGIGTKELTGKNAVEQFQKTQEESDLEHIESEIAKASGETKTELESIRDAILEQINKQKKTADVTKDLHAIVDAESLKDYSLEDLVSAYNGAKDAEGYIDRNLQAKAMARIGHYLNETGKERLRKNEKFIESEANKKDITWSDIWFKTLSHFTEKFPEMQEFSKLFDDAFLTMQQQRNAEKRKLEKLGKAVIKEANKKLGLPEKALSLFSSNSAKYFEYLDNGKGQFITDTKGLNKAQVDFLNYMKELVKDRKAVDEEGNELDNAILQTDKGFNETYKSEGFLKAMSLYMGGGNNIDVEVVNPLTGVKEPYQDAQKSIIDAANKGAISKPKALLKLLRLANRAKKEHSNYSLDYNGQLTSKFDQPRDKSAGYSKDFYAAAMRFIDDKTHVENMNKIVPIVNSLEQLYEHGFDAKFPNVQKFLKEWKEEQIYKKEKVTDPTLDKLLKFFRVFTSQIAMSFNYPAAVMNLAMGQYNNWRSEGSKLWAKGNGRLFGKGGFNKYGTDLLEKYNVVESDYDSNPKLFAGKLFDLMAYGAQRFGEYQIQGSMFLGQLTDKEWDSFEYKDGELVPKEGMDEKELTTKFNQYKNRISDIQGKYSEKDRRNFMRFEAGKNAIQFRVWAIDWLKERFGGKYIDAHNVEHSGSWNMFTKEALKELREQFNEKGIIKGAWENKQIMTNLRGAMIIALLYTLKYIDDEDKDKQRKALSLDNALGNMWFIFDPEQAKYMLKQPVASFGTVNKFIDALEAVVKQDKGTAKKVKKVIPYNKALDLIPQEKKK